MNDYVPDFKLLPTSIVLLNKLITDCIADHALIKKVKFLRPPVHGWKIQSYLQQRNILNIYEVRRTLMKLTAMHSLTTGSKKLDTKS